MLVKFGGFILRIMKIMLNNHFKSMHYEELYLVDRQRNFKCIHCIFSLLTVNVGFHTLPKQSSPWVIKQ